MWYPLLLSFEFCYGFCLRSKYNTKASLTSNTLYGYYFSKGVERCQILKFGLHKYVIIAIEQGLSLFYFHGLNMPFCP